MDQHVEISVNDVLDIPAPELIEAADDESHGMSDVDDSHDSTDSVNAEHSLSRDLAESISKELEVLRPLSGKCCIYRIPKSIVKQNPNLYTPHEISIGPFHHGKEELKEMEEHKKRYLVEFLKWSHMTLQQAITLVEKHETRLRNSYAHTIDLDSGKFIRMMLIDAAFLIVFLMKSRFPNLHSSDDRIFQKAQLVYYVKYDLILLENQIPFFILDYLFEAGNLAGRTRGLSMIKLIHSCFKGRCGMWITEDVLQRQDLSQVEHILDFFRISQYPQKQKPKTKVKKLELPTITELFNAGAKFEVHPSTYKVDIEFDKKKGILKIPFFSINKETEVFLKNLQHYENSHCVPKHKYVNDYLCTICLLVRDSKDVELLDRSGILENWIGNNQKLATIFNSMTWRFHQNFFHFADTFEDLNIYCKDRWNRMKGNLKQNYFNTPWAGISVFAAAFLLALTIVQTVFSILQVV